MQHYLPTRLYFGPDCVAQQAAELRTLGTKALVVTGPNSAVKSGAWNDLQLALQTQGLEYVMFAQVEPDPVFATVERGVSLGRQNQIDFVIGIGGGSALDAAKVMALLLANPSMTIEQTFVLPDSTVTLPVVAIPTTAGTGSEVTPFAVLTDHGRETKRAIRHRILFPQLALVDERYTYSLPLDITRDTAMDALSHLIEGYLATMANAITEAEAEQGMRIFSQCWEALRRGVFLPQERKQLALASVFGGRVIAVAGTATVHALGFPLTYYQRIPHGRANGCLLANHLIQVGAQAPKVLRILECLDLSSLAELGEKLKVLVGHPLRLTGAEARQAVCQAMASRNHANNPYPVTEPILFELLEKSCMMVG